MVIAAEFVDLRDPVERFSLFLDHYAMEFIKAVNHGGPECLLCGKLLCLKGPHQAIVYGRMEGLDSNDEAVMINFGCCKRCFKKYNSFSDAIWGMGETIRLNFKLT